jgi:hypothetical protein
MTSEKTETKVGRRSGALVGWIIPGAVLALLPKCPLCLTAYVAAGTGIGLSLSAATHLRSALLFFCAVLILFFAAISTRRLISNKAKP